MPTNLLVLLSLILAIPGFSKAADERPNVILILADDLGFSDLGCYGGEIPTPNLDALASDGLRFSAFYTSARCCPSRASLITGLHPHQAGIGSFATKQASPTRGEAYTGHLLPSCVTLAEILTDAGYSTWMVGKWHMGVPGPVERGFQNFYGYVNGYAQDQWSPGKYERLPKGSAPELSWAQEDFYATDAFTDYALEFLSQARAKDQPYFLYLAHSSPHFPVQAPKESIDRHMETYLRGWDALRQERFDRQKEMGLFPDDSILPPRSMVPVEPGNIANGFSGEPNPAWDSLPKDRQVDLARRMATFAAMVEHVDQGVGQIVEDLKKNGELDYTLILFLSDNGACYEWGPFGFDGQSRKGTNILHRGELLDQMGQAGSHQSYGSGWANLGNTPLNMYKHFCHEGGIASPLLVRWPKGLQQEGVWVDEPSHLMDIVPTVLEATGATYPLERNGQPITPVAGASLLGSMNGAALAERALPFEHQGARGLRQGNWKITYGKRQPTEPAWQLFDLESDRSEQSDLSQERPEVASQLIAKWEDWATTVGAEPFYEPLEGKESTPASVASGSPQIANQPLTIVVEVKSAAPQGVVLAQGGNQHGYALHFDEGKPTFDVRVNAKVSRLQGDPVKGAIRLEASLDAKEMRLLINGEPSLSAPSPGLIPVTPIDALSIGQDIRTAAGNYSPPNPFNGTILSTRIDTAGKPPAVASVDRASVAAGLKSHQKAIFVKEGWIRDPYIILGPDDWYYLTGTTPNPEEPREHSDPYNTGLGEESIVGWKAQIWRSQDLSDWESLEAPFSLKDGVWWTASQKDFQQVEQEQWRLWAPELHWIGDRWALVHTSPSPVKGANLSLSLSAEVKGPWSNPMETRIGRRHDPSLFRDDDGVWWLVWGATSIAPLKADFTDFAGSVVHIGPSGDTAKMGHEGCLIQKILGKWVLFGTGWSTGEMRRGSYNLYYATADNLTGPYSERKFAGRFLGHGTPFQDRDGRWWCTAFYNANVPPVPRNGIESRDLSDTAQTINQRGTTLVPLDVRLLDNGDLYIRAKDPAYATPGPDEAQQFPF